MHALAFCVLLAQSGAATAMPPQPDFSGRWTLVVAVPSDGHAASTLNVRLPVTRTNIRGEPMAPFYGTIEIERQFSAATMTETHRIGVRGGTVGGVVMAAPDAPPRSHRMNSHHAVTWADRTLVFEHGTFTGDAWQTGDWTEYRETWALQPNGELAIDIATGSSAERPRTVSATYRRSE